MMCKNIFRRNICVLQVFLCALFSWPVCAWTHAQLRGNFGQQYCC